MRAFEIKFLGRFHGWDGRMGEMKKRNRQTKIFKRPQVSLKVCKYTWVWTGVRIAVDCDSIILSLSCSTQGNKGYRWTVGEDWQNTEKKKDVRVTCNWTRISSWVLILIIASCISTLKKGFWSAGLPASLKPKWVIVRLKHLFLNH